jgi:hypothetical protein
LTTLYLYTVGATAALTLTAFALAVRRRTAGPFTAAQLATLSVLVCLMHVSVMPWRIGLAKAPGVDALIFSIPFTTCLVLGLRLVPRPGAATLLIVGQGILGQFVGSGPNPVWWPYFLAMAAVVELIVVLSGRRLGTLAAALGIGAARAAVGYSYMYLVMSPFVWKHFYPAWYFGAKLGLGVVGACIGAVVAHRLAPVIRDATEAVA